MSSGCDIRNVTRISTLYDSCYDQEHAAKVTSGIFFADALLCLTLACISHFKYSSVTVFNYSVSTKATSNTRWIWFFILTTLSSLMTGLNFLLSIKKQDEIHVLFIIGWISHLLAVLSLALAIKYQWKYREEAFHKLRVCETEKSPILSQQNAESKHLCPVDVLLLSCFVIAVGFFIAGLSLHGSSHHQLEKIFYWIAFSFSWLLRIVIFIMVIIVHYKMSKDGPSVFTKCVLLAAVLFNTPCDIPSYIWIKCIMNDHPHKASTYYALVGVVVLSHILFFSILRSEFLRLKDITRWHIAANIEKLENENVTT